MISPKLRAAKKCEKVHFRTDHLHALKSYRCLLKVFQDIGHSTFRRRLEDMSMLAGY